MPATIGPAGMQITASVRKGVGQVGRVVFLILSLMPAVPEGWRFDRLR